MTRSILAPAAVIVLLVSSLSAPGAVAPAVAAEPAVGECVAGWQELTIPEDSFRSAPFEVVTQRGKLRWILGSTDDGVLALRWNGKRLVTRDIGPGKTRGLVGAVAMGRRKALGVGAMRPGQYRLDELIGTVSWSRWRDARPPVEPFAQASLADVARLPSGRAWAVGASLRRGRAHAISLVRSGGTWHRKRVLAAGRVSGLLGVARSPSGVVWAVGWRDSGSGVLRPLVLRRRSTDWKLMPSVGVPAGTGVLTGIGFGSGPRGWAVGYSVKAGTSFHQPFLSSWNGKAWKRSVPPWAKDVSAVPRAVAVDDDGSLWVVGTQLANGTREARGFLAHGRGSSWTVRVLDTPSGARSDLTSVALTSGGAVVAGTVAASAIALRTCEAAGPAAAGRRVAVSRMQKRRQLRDPHAGTAVGAAVDIAATGPRTAIPAAVAPEGFRVRDMSEEAGLSFETLSYGVARGDLDGNGWTDVFVSRHWNKRPLMALGGPDGFETSVSGLFDITDRHGCDIGDIDDDGRGDVLCATGRARGTGVDGHVVAMAPAYPDGELARAGAGLVDPFGRGRLVRFIRLDGDAYPEAYVVNQPDRLDSMPGPNRFFRNDGGRFVPAPKVGLDTAVGGVCLETFDMDGDGDQDLLHCQTQPGDGRAPGLRIHRNVNGRLVERSRVLGVKPIADLDVTMADVDGDGRRDLIQLSKKTLRISRATANGFKLRYQAKVSGGRAVAAGDVNGDGRADVYIVRSGWRKDKPDRLLISRNRGKSFTSVFIPQADAGLGDDVVALDYDKNGLTDFVVVNGRNSSPGPVQLLASFLAET